MWNSTTVVHPHSVGQSFATPSFCGGLVILVHSGSREAVKQDRKVKLNAITLVEEVVLVILLKLS